MNAQKAVFPEQRVLLVDDDRDFTEALYDLLEPEGYTIRIAHDLAAAGRVAKEYQPHAALLDIRLGGDNGIEFLQLLKQECPDTVCIMLTAYANVDTTIDSLRLGAYDYLRKPVEARDLLAALKRGFDKLRLLEEKRRAEQALLQSEERFRGLVTNIPGAVYRCRVDELLINMVFISDVIEKISGYPASDFIDYRVRSFSDIIHPEDLPAMLENRRKDVQHNVPYVLEYRIIHKHGGIRWVYDKGQGVRDQQGILVSQDGAIFDITESHDLSEQLAYYANHDVLTGLVNRREFEHRLNRVLETARQDQSEHALCYMDLDQFKVINDTSGHVAGDELLRQLGSLLNKLVRRRDTLSRLGGDEFGILMEHCTLDQAKRVANKLRQTIEDFRFVWEDRIFSVGVSIGLVPITGTSVSAIEILKQADAACYAAKDTGRNRIHIYADDDTELARRSGEMQWVAQINRALDEDKFCLYAQAIKPVLRRARDAGEHYELLVRMVDQDGRLILPGAFLPSAERYNLSPRIDRWVVDHAIQWLLTAAGSIGPRGHCSINLSGLSLGDDLFLSHVVSRLRDTGLPPARLCFEITETAAIANLSSATMFIKTLKNLGCQFALDDFGSGLSSFAYLKTLPVDYLKIDGVFVKDIETDPIDLAMVKSINDIGKVMGKKTIAEFVEDAGVLSKLREIGVDYAQGYYIGKPFALAQLEKRRPVGAQHPP